MTIYLSFSLPKNLSDYMGTGEQPFKMLMFLYQSCSGRGLQGCSVAIAAGELLPRLSTLTGRSRRYISVALSLESPPPDVIRRPALWSSDFPRIFTAVIRPAQNKQIILCTQYGRSFHIHNSRFSTHWKP